jgi:hypothetical protein
VRKNNGGVRDESIEREKPNYRSHKSKAENNRAHNRNKTGNRNQMLIAYF